jgi:hypothetical protein
MKNHRGTLYAYYYVKEASLEGLHAVWFHLWDFQEKLMKSGCQS